MSQRRNCEKCSGWGTIMRGGKYESCDECEGSGRDPAIVGYSGAEWDQPHSADYDV